MNNFSSKRRRQTILRNLSNSDDLNQALFSSIPHTPKLQRFSDPSVLSKRNSLQSPSSTLPQSPRQSPLKQQYDYLQHTYQKLLLQNKTLKQYSQSSISTLRLDPIRGKQLQNQAKEVESLYKVISEAHQSLGLLISHVSYLETAKEEYLKKLTHLKYLRTLLEVKDAVKVKLVIIKQLSEVIGKKVNLIQKIQLGNKSRKESLRENQESAKELKERVRAIEREIQAKEGECEGSIVQVAELYESLTLNEYLLEYTGNKVMRYELHIKKMKK